LPAQGFDTRANHDSAAHLLAFAMVGLLLAVTAVLVSIHRALGGSR
jgi:hypothetical protein